MSKPHLKFCSLIDCQVILPCKILTASTKYKYLKNMPMIDILLASSCEAAVLQAAVERAKWRVTFVLETSRTSTYGLLDTSFVSHIIFKTNFVIFLLPIVCAY
jgi:hypothetical protein